MISVLCFVKKLHWLIKTLLQKSHTIKEMYCNKESELLGISLLTFTSMCSIQQKISSESKFAPLKTDYMEAIEIQKDQ